MDITPIIRDFYKVVDEVYGLYLDACMGFNNNVTRLISSQTNFMKANDMTIEEQDTRPFVIGKGEPDDSPNIQHSCTQKKFKERNAENGFNAQFMAGMCLVSIFHYWDEEYRNKRADAVNLKHGQIKSDIMGDIRLIRNIVIHKKGVSDQPKTAFKVIDFIEEGQAIRISETQMDGIVMSIYTKLDVYTSDRTA